jgi:hypothetical protein
MHGPQVTVGTFEDMDSARRLERTLREIGIESDTLDDSQFQTNLLRVKPLASFHVQVKKEDVVRAERAMAEWHSQLQGLITCPSCGKSKIVFPQVSRKFQNSMWPVLLLCKAGLLEPSFFCEDCSYEWSARLPEKSSSNEH